MLKFRLGREKKFDEWKKVPCLLKYEGCGEVSRACITLGELAKRASRHLNPSLERYTNIFRLLFVKLVQKRNW